MDKYRRKRWFRRLDSGTGVTVAASGALVAMWQHTVTIRGIEAAFVASFWRCTCCMIPLMM